MIERQAESAFTVTAMPAAYPSAPPLQTSFVKTGELSGESNTDFAVAHSAAQTHSHAPHPTALSLILFLVSSLLTICAFMRRAASRRVRTGDPAHV